MKGANSQSPDAIIPNAFSKPVHVEVRPRDSYLHHVPVERAGSVISFNFFTRRKNISFGLFYLHVNQAKDSTAELARASFSGHNTKSSDLARESLRPGTSSVPSTFPKINYESSADIKTVIGASRVSAIIEPHVVGRESKDDLSESLDSSASLARSQTINSRHSNSSRDGRTPDICHGVSSSASISAFNSTEFIEIIPISKYPSFEHTITGSYTAPIAGIYVLYFDNSFSINTSKELFLTVSVGAAAPIKEKEESSFSGWLLKKKQRRLQGWARRWFELSQRGTLSYFADRFSPCRGSVNIHQCTITKVPHRSLITVDSGEVTFHMRALNSEDFQQWSDRLHSALALSSGAHLGEPPSTDAVPEISNAALFSFSEEIIGKLALSEKHLAEIRQVAASTEDGSIKFVGPLGKRRFIYSRHLFTLIL